MIHIWNFVVDFLFPPSESLKLIRLYRYSPPENYYQPKSINQVVVLTNYQTPFIKACVRAGKFEHNIKALQLLSSLLKKYLAENEPTIIPSSTVFVPVPLHRKREHERGYNQVEVIIKSAIKNTDYRLCRLIERTINTSPQSHLKRQERLSHLERAFCYKNENIDWSSLKTVVLVDDVTTSGSTLKAAKNTLAPHLPPHIKLICLAIAH